MGQATKVSMRHLYLYTYLLLEEAKKQGRPVRLEWADIGTASIGCDPRNPKGLLMRLSRMAATGSEEDATLLRALIAHEILVHGNHTDFSVDVKRGIEGVVGNILEDQKEKMAQERFPGSKKVIREGLEILVAKGLYGPPKEGKETPASILSGWLVTELRSEYLGQQCLSDFSTEFRKLAIQTFGTKLTGKVKMEALRGAQARTTTEAQESAARIVELLQMAAKEQEDQHKDPRSTDSESGQPDPQEGQADASSGEDPGESNSGTSSNVGGEPGADGSSQQGDSLCNGSTSNGSQQNGTTTGSDEGFEPSGDDLIRAIGDVLNATPDQVGNYGKPLEQVLGEGNEAIQQAEYQRGNHTNEMEEVTVPDNPSETNRSELRAGAKALASQLSLRMEELLEASSMVERAKSCEGRLKTNRVWRAALGDMKVFQRRHRDAELDTCMYFLKDESLSMAEAFGDLSRTQAAGRVLTAAAEVLDRAEIPFGISSYNTVVREWQEIGGDWSQTALSYRDESRSCTNTHLAVVWAIRKFISCPQARKILTVITDGDPGDNEVLEAALREASAFGVEVRFVLIGSGEASFYQGISASFGVAETPAELAQAVFGSLEALVS